MSTPIRCQFRAVSGWQCLLSAQHPGGHEIDTIDLDAVAEGRCLRTYLDPPCAPQTCAQPDSEFYGKPCAVSALSDVQRRTT